MSPIVRNKIIRLVLALLLLFLPEWIYRGSTYELSASDAASRLSSGLQQLEETALRNLDIVHKHIAAASPLSGTDADAEWFYYSHDSLVKWSGNHAPEIARSSEYKRNGKIIRTGNGYYLATAWQEKNQRLCVLVPVAQDYRFTNYYLNNAFSPRIDLQGEYELSLKPGKGLRPVLLHDNPVMYIGKSLSGKTFSFYYNLLLLFQVAGFFLLYLALTSLMLRDHVVLHPRQVAFWVLALSGLRLLFLFFSVFKLQSDSPWFNPEIFASGMWAPSLGDFFLNAWSIFFICTSLSGQFEKTSHPALWVRKTAGWVIIPLFVLLSWYIRFSFTALVLDSGINFSIRDISSFTSYSLLGLLSVGLLFFALYRLIHAWAKLSADSGLKRGLLWAMLAWPLLILLSWPGDLYAFAGTCWPVLCCVLYMLLYVRDRKFTLNWLIILLGLFSLASVITLQHYGEEKEKKNRLLIAERISTDEDPETEIEFSGFEKSLAQDTLLIHLADSTRHVTNETFYEYLDSAYFRQINNHYHVSCFLFRADSTPVFSNLYMPGLLPELSEILRNHSRTGVSSVLRIVPERQNGLLYAGLMPIRSASGKTEGILAVELRPKLIPDRPGLQELLWHKNQVYRDVLENYSIIRYVKDNTILKTGSFFFSGDYHARLKDGQRFRFFDTPGISHLAFRSRPQHVTIISYQHSNWLSRATSFSYVFIIYTLLFLTLLAVFRWQKWNIRHFSLRGKIQASLVVLLLLAMALLAAGTQYIVSKQYREKNFRLLAEKLESITSELQPKVISEEQLDEDARNYIGYLLVKYSRVFHTDIHFYGPQGKLIGSSIPEIFRFGIQPDLMNHAALEKLRNGQTNEYVQTENISTLGYLSGYRGLVNNKGHVLGYINVAFFAPRASVDAEISSIVMAIVNIFVILFVLALAASLVFTQIVTAPLRKIQGSLASVQLNRINKPIEYSGKDEIADLVMEYNRKVAELELYAQELARSERESAWREMARQVAHEIKNPLTPMKLNIQHMQRTLKSNDPELENKVRKLSASLIEQIDILTHIASDFSNMAKMPLARMEELELYGLIENVMGLFADTENVKLQLLKAQPEPVMIRADRDQLVRVFNNLVKNAIQAMPEMHTGRVEIEVKKHNDLYYITVSDNGSGIPDELKDKIFRPNFTTKNTGTGLGLAMVKSIIEQHGGTIWFDSDAGKGTVFSFTLPVA